MHAFQLPFNVYIALPSRRSRLRVICRFGTRLLRLHRRRRHARAIRIRCSRMLHSPYLSRDLRDPVTIVISLMSSQCDKPFIQLISFVGLPIDLSRLRIPSTARPHAHDIRCTQFVAFLNDVHAGYIDESQPVPVTGRRCLICILISRPHQFRIG
jgi:hypothetical protein